MSQRPPDSRAAATAWNDNLDAVRVIAAFAVVWLHVSAGAVVSHPDPRSLAWWVGNLADACSRWCVPVFVMISGSVLLASGDQRAPMDAFLHRLARLLPLLGFWSLFYLLLRLRMERHFGARDVFESIVKGTPFYHLWYLYMTVGLAFATPFLRLLQAQMNNHGMLFMAAGCFAIAALEILPGGGSSTFLPLFLKFIGYYVAGHYLSQLNRSPPAPVLLAAAAACALLIACGTALLLPAYGAQAWTVMYSYQNPLVIVMSLCIFVLLIKQAPPPRRLRAIAPLTLGIYLIHPFWLSILSKFLGLSALTIHPLLGIPLTTSLTFGLSALCAGALARIRLLRWTVR